MPRSKQRSHAKTSSVDDAPGRRLGGAAFRHHGGELSALAFSPSGDCVAAGSEDGQVELFSTTSGVSLGILSPPPSAESGKITALAFAPDGQHVAALRGAPLGGHTTRWERAWKRAEKTGVLHVRDLPSSGPTHPTVLVWNVASRMLVVARADVYRTTIAFSPDGAVLATGAGGNHSILVVDARTGVERRRIEASCYDADLAFSPDGRQLAAARAKGFDKIPGAVTIYEVATGVAGATFELPELHERSLRIRFRSRDELLLVGFDGTLLSCRLPRGKKTSLGRLPGKDPEVVALALDAAGEVIAGTFMDNRLSILRPGKPRTIDQSRVRVFALSADGSRLATADGLTVRVWNTKEGKELRLPAAVGHSENVDAMVFDGDRVVTYSHKESLTWDVATGAPRARVGKLPRAPDELTAYVKRAFPAVAKQVADHSPHLLEDGRSVLFRALSRDGENQVWDLETGTRRAVLVDKTLRSPALSPSGELLAISLYGGVIRCIDLATGKATKVWRVRAPTSRLAWTPDGRSIVAGGEDRVLRVLGVGSRGPVRQLKGHKKVINGVACSPDGELIASSDGTRLILWPLKGRKPPAISAQPGRVLVFSQAGDLLGMGDGPTPVLLDVASLRR